MTGSDGGFTRISPNWRGALHSAVLGYRTNVVLASERDHRPRFLYVIECGGFVKVGYATCAVTRLKSIQSACPHDPRLVHYELIERWYAAPAEKGAHAALAPCLHRGEWFCVSPEMAVEVVQEACRIARRMAESHRVIAEADRRNGIRRDAKGRAL